MIKIGIFTYDFEHKKTQEGLLHLFLHGYKPEVIFAAPYRKLDVPKPAIKTTVAGMKYLHPKDIADRLNIAYKIYPHNLHTLPNTIKLANLDLGIILGARILPEKVINSFNIGILNMHPGLLPQNRGLDTIFHAWEKNIQQGVTTHLIDKHVDRGRILLQEPLEIFEDDTWIDINLRIQNKELELMIKSIQKLTNEQNSREYYEKYFPYHTTECMTQLIQVGAFHEIYGGIDCNCSCHSKELKKQRAEQMRPRR